MKLLIKNAHIIDPANDLDGVSDILIENSVISKIAKGINANSAKIIDAKDKIVMPGIIDMHVHLREPGREDKETVASATAAALKGGVTGLLAMPNTNPAIDTPENVKLLKGIIAKSAQTKVFICGAITKARAGQELSDMRGMKQEGAIAVSDDGASVDSPELMQAALETAKKEKILVLAHCEDKALSNQGVVNLGLTSTRMGLRGISKESEYKRISRDIGLAVKLDAPLHIAHVSCAESVEIIALAKKKGVKLTCETAPHYFCLSEAAVWHFDPNMKINPPLRGDSDIAAIKDGLKNDIIDVIVSDHAPHTENEKDIEFQRAEFGTIGLETLLAVSITELLHKRILSWKQLVEKLTLNPARILGLRQGALSEGSEADLIVIDPNAEWLVEKSKIISKSKNSAFLGMGLKGKVEYTIVNGKVAYNE